MKILSEKEKEGIRRSIWGNRKTLPDGTVYYSKGKIDQILLSGARTDIDELKEFLAQQDPTRLPEDKEKDVKRLEVLHNTDFWSKTKRDLKEELKLTETSLWEIVVGLDWIENRLLEIIKNWTNYKEEKNRLESQKETLKMQVKNFSSRKEQKFMKVTGKNHEHGTPDNSVERSEKGSYDTPDNERERE